MKRCVAPNRFTEEITLPETVKNQTFKMELPVEESILLSSSQVENKAATIGLPHKESPRDSGLYTTQNARTMDSPGAFYSLRTTLTGKSVYKHMSRETKRQYKEMLISPAHLCAGMVLSRDLTTPQGVKLLQKGTIMHPKQLEVIKGYITRNKLERLEIYILKP